MISYHTYYAFMPTITSIWTNFVKTTFSKSIIFRVKSIFEQNVHVWKKTRIVYSRSLNDLNIQKKNWFVLRFEHVKFLINEKYFKKFMTFQIIMFPLWFLNIQKFSFKECPLTWVAPLTMFLSMLNFQSFKIPCF